MAVKIGDKVRYLNAIGGGVVTCFQSKNVVLVEEDGFESPVLVTDIVVVEPTNEFNFPIEDLKPKRSKGVETEFVEEEEKDVELEYQWNEREETEDGEKLSVYLAFVPKDVKKLQTCDMELYVVNDSNYFMQFAIFTGVDEKRVVVHSDIEPQTKIYVKDINKLELNEYEHIQFQAFAYKRVSFSMKPAIDFAVRIHPVKYYKLHSFRENDFFDEDAMMITIIENDVLNYEIQIDPVILQQAIQSKEREEPKKQSKKQKKADVIEVDLHIHELLDNTSGMTNFEMLGVQMKKFSEVMEENLRFKGQKIVFIHGKGEGVLRAEIEKELKKKYKSCRVQDASFQQYGFGATQVTIR